MKRYNVRILAHVRVKRHLTVIAEDEDDLEDKINSEDIEFEIDDDEGEVDYDLSSMEINSIEECDD